MTAKRALVAKLAVRAPAAATVLFCCLSLSATDRRHMNAYLASFEDKSVDETRCAIDKMASDELDKMANRRSEMVIVHLQSARGSELNGQRCYVVGCDPPSQEGRRLHVKMSSGEGLRIRATNLCSADLHSSEPSRSSMSVQNLAMVAGSAIRSRGSGDGTVSRVGFVLGQLGRFDLLASLDEFSGADWRTLVDQALRSPVPCCHWNVMGCCDALSEKEKLVAKAVTGFGISSCYGDGLVHLERLGEGIISCGDLTCSICLETIASGEFVSSLPCGHQFHEECITPALKATGMKCPNCRFEIKGDPNAQFNAYTLPALHRIVKRFFEFIDSGMCERCQMAILEKQQYGYVTLADGKKVLTAGGMVTPNPLNIDLNRLSDSYPARVH